MPNADSASPQPSRTTRLARSQQSVFRGSVDGRVRQASPVPVRDTVETTRGSNLFVGPEDPGRENFDFWFDTDEPVV